MINSKKKGNAGENRFANWLQDNGIKAWKDSASGGGSREKADVGCNIGMHFEVKTVKSLNLRKAWKQTNNAAGMTHTTPVLAVHLDGMPENEWLMVLNNWDWLELTKKDSVIKTDYVDPTLKYNLLMLVETCKKIIKKLEVGN